jgi:hypothetical protein
MYLKIRNERLSNLFDYMVKRFECFLLVTTRVNNARP